MSESLQENVNTATEARTPLVQIFLIFLRLGCTSFGGPVAHLGYFRDEFVGRRKWIEERAYADLVALCQFLPGPASSQVGIGVGLSRGGLPILATIYPSHTIALVESFYSSGSLVFGGGHVVLPLLQAEVVPPDWVSNDSFLAGYGAAQAVPGPLFTFAAYLGTVLEPVPNGVAGGFISAWWQSSYRHFYWSSALYRSGTGYGEPGQCKRPCSVSTPP